MSAHGDNEPVRPHLRDFFAGYRFRPHRIAADRHGAWVSDAFLPLLARIDGSSDRVTGPFALLQGDGAISALALHDQTLIVQRREGVVVLDTAAGTQRLQSGQTLGVAAGPEGAWALHGGRSVKRLDRDVGAELPMTCSHVAVGHGSLWALGMGYQPEAPVVVQVDPQRCRVTRVIGIPGAPQQIGVDPAGVWVNTWVGGQGAGPITTHLVTIDAESGAIVSETSVEPVGALGPVIDGTLWIDARDPFGPAAVGPTKLRRIGLSDGCLRGELEVEGVLSWPVGGAGELWAVDEATGGVVAIDVRDERVRRYWLKSLDVSPHLPPPSPRISADETERNICARISRSLRSGLIESIDVEDVRVEGAFPDTTIVALFRSDRRPGVLFGRRCRVWESDGAFASDLVPLMDINLQEDIEACGYGLPTEPIGQEVVWF